MVQTNGKAENQHYVPRVLLRNFGVPETGRDNPRVHVFDKLQSRRFTTNIVNVVAERNFYRVSSDASESDFEGQLTKLEERVREPFVRLMEHRCLKTLKSDDGEWIALFVAIQHLRTRGFRENVRALDQALRDKVVRMGFRPDQVENHRFFDSENDVRHFSLAAFAKVAPEIVDRILAKRWLLFETSDESPFWVSDNPVVLHNDQAFGPHGNLGFDVPEIQVFLPVSPTLALAWFCPTIEAVSILRLEKGRAAMARMASNLRSLPGYDSAADEAMLDEIERTALGEAIDFNARAAAGIPHPCSAGNVTFLNSLQVKFAERFIISRRDDFALAEQMLATEPSLRSGMRFKFD